ncbi:MAG: tetratricopeptide repeat protein [Asgard group archaeon]|nr:tetratricopeptide repeat protein [Asgard group archaeon]
MTGSSEDNYYLKKGKIAFKEGDFKQAIECFQKVLELNENNIDAQFNIGLSFNEIGDYSSVIFNLEKIIEHKEEDAVFWSILGNAYDKLKKYSDALHAYKNAYKLSSIDADKGLLVAKIDNLVLKIDYSEE